MRRWSRRLPTIVQAAEQVPSRLDELIAESEAAKSAPDRWVLGPDGTEWDTWALMGTITPDELRDWLWREEPA